MKKRIIAITLVLSLMIMGVAYAAWSEPNEVKTQIHTGELDVNVVRVDTFSPLDTDSELVWGGQDCDEEGRDPNYLNFVVKNFYPGADYEAVVRFKNEGTISADIDYKTFVSNLPAGYSFYVTDIDGNNMRTWKTVTVAPGATAKIKIKLLTNNNIRLTESAEWYYFNVKFDISQFNVD